MALLVLAPAVHDFPASQVPGWHSGPTVEVSMLQAECEAADLKESYDVRWVTFAAQSSPASLGDVPFPVHQDDSHLLLDVLLWGAQVALSALVSCCRGCRLPGRVHHCIT